jgi:electron transfer flavoprotein beta subunit
MNIVVCIKQVLDTTDIKFDQATGYLKRAGAPVMISSLDEYAVEEALRLKEAHGGTVKVLAMGPATAIETLRHAIAMGADDAVHVCDDALAGSDSAATAYVLARAIAKIGAADLIICGAETIDGNTAYVGPAVAEMLGLPCVTFVSKIEEIVPGAGGSGGKLVARRMMEEGYDRVECPTPAVLTVVKAINEPRISSLKGKMRAKKYQPEVVAVAALPSVDPARVGAAGATSRVVRTFPPEPRPTGVVITGEPDEIAEKLFQALKK